MKRSMTTLIAILLTAWLTGCSQSNTPPAASSTPQAISTASADKVKVSAEGTKFDPPVAKAKIPDDAWACIMDSTVHFASMDKGTGKCPTCKMKLHQNASQVDQ